MGSFNTSCFVSQQTIVPEAESYILPIYQSHNYGKIEIELNGKEYEELGNYNSTCYPNAFWGYAGPLFKGKYDDYGCFILHEDIHNHINFLLFFDELYKNLFVTLQGNNEYHDLGIDFKSLYIPEKKYSFNELHEIWDKVWEVGQKGRLYIKDIMDAPCQLQFAVMHKATANSLINYVANEEERIEYFDKYIEQKLKMIFPDVHNNSFFISQLALLERFRIGEGSGEHFSFYSGMDYSCEDVIKRYESQKLEDCLKEIKEDLYDVFEVQIEHRYIYEALNCLNIKLSPMVYASQDYQNEIGIEYTKLVKEVNAKIVQELKEKYDDWEDCDDEEDKYVLIKFKYTSEDNISVDTSLMKVINSNLNDFRDELEDKLKDYFQTQDSMDIFLSENTKVSIKSVENIMNNISISLLPQDEYELIVKHMGQRTGPFISFLETDSLKSKLKLK